MEQEIDLQKLLIQSLQELAKQVKALEQRIVKLEQYFKDDGK